MHLHTDKGFQHRYGSEITPRAIYAQRREMLRLLAGGAAGALLAGWAQREAIAQTPAPGRLAAPPVARSNSAVCWRSTPMRTRSTGSVMRSSACSQRGVAG